MPELLTLEQRIEIVLLAATGSYRHIANTFNLKYPDRQPPLHHSAVAKIISKFKETGSVKDKERSGPKKTVTNEDMAANVLGAFSLSPKKSTRRMALEVGISQGSVMNILHQNRWHPYKLQMYQHLNEDDPDRRLEFCEWLKKQ